MFRDVPECFGMLRNVPCSWFYRRPSNLRKFENVSSILLTNLSFLNKKNSSINKESNFMIKMTHLVHLSRKPVS